MIQVELHKWFPERETRVAKAKLINGTLHFLPIRKTSITDSVSPVQVSRSSKTLAQPVSKSNCRSWKSHEKLPVNRVFDRISQILVSVLAKQL